MYCPFKLSSRYRRCKVLYAIFNDWRFISQYVEEKLDGSLELVFWICGHSRGGAIANILGAEIGKQLGHKTFTYTLVAPNTTTAENASEYKGIFNLVNSDDFVSYLPIEAWDFGRYGKTITMSLGDNYRNEWKNLVGEAVKKGYNRVNKSGLRSTINALADVAYDRNSCYVYTCDCHGIGTDNDIIATNYGRSKENRDIALAKIPENAKKYCEIALYDQGGVFSRWDFKICQTPAYYMQLMAAVSADELDKITFGVELDIAPRYRWAHPNVVASALAGIKHPHFPETYYVLSGHVKNATFSD